eukprot:scaffold3961_cov66-Phaeocystis_antarctica.AAC.4
MAPVSASASRAPHRSARATCRREEGSEEKLSRREIEGRVGSVVRGGAAHLWPQVRVRLQHFFPRDVRLGRWWLRLAPVQEQLVVPARHARPVHTAGKAARAAHTPHRAARHRVLGKRPQFALAVES